MTGSRIFGINNDAPNQKDEGPINYLEEIKSSSSFVSGNTSRSKYEVDNYVREKEDIKSRFDSSSSDDDSSSSEEVKKGDTKDKLNFLVQSASLFETEDAGDDLARQDSGIKPKTKKQF